MFLSAKKMRGLIVHGGELVDNSGTRFVRSLVELPGGEPPHLDIEGSSYDLTLGEVGRLSLVCPMLGRTGRTIHRPECLAPREVRSTEGGPRDLFFLEPKRGYLLTTHEAVAIPWRYVGFLAPRASLAKCGASLIVSPIAPCFVGPITALLVTGPAGLEIEVGARFCSLRLAEIDANRPEDVEPYAGVWGTDKLTTSTDGKVVRGY